MKYICAECNEVKYSCLNQNNVKQTITKTDKYSKNHLKVILYCKTTGCGPMCTSIVMSLRMQIVIWIILVLKNVVYILVNSCHLLPKLDEIKYLFPISKSTDIFGVCETFLSDVMPDTLI